MAPRRLQLALAVVAAAGYAIDRGAEGAHNASVAEVVPSLRDVVHTVFMNGPTHSGKIGNNWPTFSAGVAGDSSSQCTTYDDAFTGYTASGAYCQASSPDLNDQAHVLVASGHLGLVLDIGGLGAAVRCSRCIAGGSSRRIHRVVRVPACLPACPPTWVPA